MEIKFGFTVNQLAAEGRLDVEDVKTLRTWAPAQNLPKLKDEQFAIFLLACYNDLDATKKTIEAYFEIKNSCPKIYDNWKLEREDLQKQLKTCEFCVMPERRADGCAVMVTKLQDFYYGNYEMAPSAALLSMTLEAMLNDNPPTGLVMLIDYNGVGLMHLTRLRMELMSASFKFLQEALPVALKEIHFLNIVYFMDKVMAIARPFLSKKAMDLMHFHQSDMDKEEFYEKWVPKRCLPEDYGGDLPPVRVLHQQNTEKLVQMQEYFEATEIQRHSVKY